MGSRLIEKTNAAAVKRIRASSSKYIGHSRLAMGDHRYTVMD